MFHVPVFSAAALLAASASFASGATTTIFAKGVSESGGWYDFKKGSSHHCWAANAANVVAWWQDRLAEKYVLPAGVPVKDGVWNTYHSSFENKSGVTSYAIEWWLDGIYRGDALSDPTTGGYYPTIDVPETPQYETTPLSQFYPLSSGSLEIFTARIVEKLESGSALTFGLYDYDKDVTVWGVEIDDETSLLTKVYLTDPSSYTVGLITAECSIVEYQDLGHTVRSYHLSGGFGSENYVTVARGLSTDVGDALPLIPEPSAAALIFGAGTLALAFSVRRRRSRGNVR